MAALVVADELTADDRIRGLRRRVASHTLPSGGESSANGSRWRRPASGGMSFTAPTLTS
jgi:hypothetical protein